MSAVDDEHGDSWEEPLQVSDELGGDVQPAAPDPDRPYACPECGKTYTSPGGLRFHLAAKHPGTQMPKRRREQKGEQAPRRRRVVGAAGDARQQRRRTAIRETIDELTEVAVELRTGSGQAPDNLADVLRRDADRIATSLSWVAERVNPLGRFVDLTMGHGGVITIARGFNGIGLWFLRTWRQALTRRQQEQEEQTRAMYLDEIDGDEEEHGGTVDEPGGGDAFGPQGPLV